MIITWKSSGGTSVTFSKSDPTYILLKNYDGFATPDVNYKTISAPFQDGVTLLDTKFAPRKFSIGLAVAGPTLSDVQTAVNNLIRLVNPASGPGLLGFTYENGTTYYITASGKVLPSSSDRSDKHQRVQITFQAHTPFWSTTAQVISIGTAGAVTFDPAGVANLKWPFTLPSNTASVVATNYGDIPSGGTFVINGQVQNPKVTNSTTGLFFKFTISMDAGDTMTITTGFGNKTISYYDASAGTTVNGFQYLTSDSTFFQLNPGPNALTFTSDSVAAATHVSISWSDQYSGV